MNIDQNKALLVDLPEEWPEKVKIALDQDEALFVDLPEEQPKKAKKTPPKITPNVGLKAAPIRILKKYQRQRQKGHLENVNKRAPNWLKKEGYLETDDSEMVDYNSDVSLADVATVDYNMGTQPNELDNDIEKIDLKNTSKNILIKKTAKKNSKKI